MKTNIIVWLIIGVVVALAIKARVQTPANTPIIITPKDIKPASL